jgi:hypothetical protein
VAERASSAADASEACTAERVREHVALPTNLLWLDAAGVGLMLSTTAQQVREEISVLPSFPKASRPARPSGAKGHPRWLASEVHEWMLAQRER